MGPLPTFITKCWTKVYCKSKFNKDKYIFIGFEYEDSVTKYYTYSETMFEDEKIKYNKHVKLFIPFIFLFTDKCKMKRINISKDAIINMRIF